MYVITRKTLIVTLAALAVSIGSATSFAGSKISPSKGDSFSWGASQEGTFWFEEVEITYLMDAVISTHRSIQDEIRFVQQALAEMMQSKPMPGSFKSNAEYNEAMDQWEADVDALVAKLELLEEELDALIIFTTSTDHISKLSGTDYGSGR